MKIKRLYLLGIGLMFTSQFLTSCHDLLEKDPTDSYSETVAWSSESSLDMYVTYLYKPLNGLSNFSSLSLTDGYTDLVKYGNGVPQTWSAHNKILGWRRPPSSGRGRRTPRRSRSWASG